MKSSSNLIRGEQGITLSRSWLPDAINAMSKAPYQGNGTDPEAWIPDDLVATGATGKVPALVGDIPEIGAGVDAEQSAGLAILAQAEEEAEAILSKARDHEAEILLLAQRAVDTMIAEAQKEITEAQQQAYTSGLEQARSEAKSYLQASSQILEEVRAWQEALVEQSTPMLVDIVKEIALKMFGAGVTLDDQALQQNLNRLLTNAKILGDITIYLNPQDALVLDSAWREVRSKIAGNRIQIVPSETITRGGCFVEGQLGSVDARVETQLNSVIAAFSESIPVDEEVL